MGSFPITSLRDQLPGAQLWAVSICPEYLSSDILMGLQQTPSHHSVQQHSEPTQNATKQHVAEDRQGLRVQVRAAWPQGQSSEPSPPTHPPFSARPVWPQISLTQRPYPLDSRPALEQGCNGIQEEPL